MKYITYDTLNAILDYKKVFWNENNIEMIEDLASKEYNLVDLVKLIDPNDETNILTYELFLNKNSDILVYDMIYKVLGYPKDKLEKEKIFDTIKCVIKEVTKYEGVDYGDIRYLNNGASTYVFRIGEKVLKLSRAKNFFVIPNNKRYLKPVIRTCINSISTNAPLIYIEVVEEVDLVDLNDKELYDLYKKLRNEGIIVLDMHTNNFGRLRKKNKLYFDINPTMESLNYTTEAPEELDKGEIVIIDNEDVITPDDYYKYKGYFDDYDIEDYEEKYMKEKTYKIV